MILCTFQFESEKDMDWYWPISATKELSIDGGLFQDGLFQWVAQDDSLLQPKRFRVSVVSPLIPSRAFSTFHFSLVLVFLLVLALIHGFQPHGTRPIPKQGPKSESPEVANSRTSKFWGLNKYVSATIVGRLIQHLQRITPAERKSFRNKKNIAFDSSISASTIFFSSLVDEMIDLNRIETGPVDLKLTSADFATFIREICLSFLSVAELGGPRLNLDIPKEKAFVDFDSVQMKRVLHRILHAVTRLAAQDGIIDIGLVDDGQCLLITVAYVDPGVSRKSLRFTSRLAGAIDHSGASRLGLFTAQKIVEGHGGTLSSRISSCSKEVVVEMRLPKARNQVAGSAVSSEELRDAYQSHDGAHGSGRNTSVLIAEDNDDLRRFLVRSLSRSYRTIEASNGLEAHRMALGCLPDLVVSDVVMPQMDGIELTRFLKTDRRTSHIPVIILTGLSSATGEQEGYETGADDYISKPFSNFLLHSRIRNLLENRRRVAEKIRRDMITSPMELTINSKDEEFLLSVIDTIESNLGEEKLGPSFIAKSLGISYSVLYKKIKSLTGLSLVEFIRDFRLKKAAKLIKRSAYNVSEASFIVGFSDAKYFSKLFKRKYGITPSSYRHFILRKSGLQMEQS